MGDSEEMSAKMIEETNQLPVQAGRICSLCGAGLAPWVPSCPYHRVETTTTDKTIWPKQSRAYEVAPREMDGYKYTARVDELEEETPFTPDEWRRYMEKEPPWEQRWYDEDTGKIVWRMG